MIGFGVTVNMASREYLTEIRETIYIFQFLLSKEIGHGHLPICLTEQQRC